MSDIVNPNGQPVSSETPRPTNENVLDFVKMQQAQQEAAQITDGIMEEGKAMSPEMIVRRTKQASAAFKITLQQFDSDAKLLEEAALDGASSVNERHQKMDQARSLRMSMTWLMAILGLEGQLAGDLNEATKPDAS